LRTGEVIGEISIPVDPRPVTPADIEERRRTAPALLSEWLEDVPWPSTFPVFSDLRVGGDRHLWVKVYQAPTDLVQQWWRFEATGELIQRATIDPTAEVMDIGPGYVLVRIRDELDREEIRLHGLVPVD